MFKQQPYKCYYHAIQQNSSYKLYKLASLGESIEIVLLYTMDLLYKIYSTNAYVSK